MTPLLRRIAFSAVVLAAFVLVAEGTSRLLLAALPAADAGGALYAELTFDDRLLWRLRPGPSLAGGVEARINAAGRRGVEDPGRPCVAFLGDSSVFGWGVPAQEAFPWASVAQAAPSLDVCNAAVPGYSSTQARLALDALAEERTLRAVVIATLWSDMMTTPWTDRDLMARFAAPEHAAALATHDLRMASGLYRLLTRLQAHLRPVPDDRRVLWNSIFEGDPKSKTRRVSVADHAAHLHAMVTTARAAGAAPVLLVLPTNRSTHLHPPDSEIDRYHGNFRDISQRMGVPLIDGNAHVDVHDPGAFLDQVHPSAAGHARLARALVPALCEGVGSEAGPSCPPPSP